VTTAPGWRDANETNMPFVERVTRSTAEIRDPADASNFVLICRYVEPPIGIEPMTYALREARSPALVA